jgi:hypothetical protein
MTSGRIEMGMILMMERRRKREEGGDKTGREKSDENVVAYL